MADTFEKVRDEHAEDSAPTSGERERHWSDNVGLEPGIVTQMPSGNLPNFRLLMQTEYDS